MYSLCSFQRQALVTRNILFKLVCLSLHVHEFVSQSALQKRHVQYCSIVDLKEK